MVTTRLIARTFLMIPLFSLLLFAETQTFQRPVLKESPAYQQYKMRGSKGGELAKMICLIDLFKNTSYTILSNEPEENAYSYLKDSKADLVTGGSGQKASELIKVYFYHGDDNEILYVKDPNGNTMPLRDLWLEELSLLEAS